MECLQRIISGTCEIDPKIKITIDTNGTLLNSEIVTFFQLYPVELNISILSLEPEKHDKMTSRKGSLRKTLEGINLLLAHNVRHNIVFPIFKGNIDEIPRVAQWSSETGAASVRFLTSIMPSGRGFSFQSKSLEAKKLLKVFDTLSFLQKEGGYGNFIKSTVPPVFLPEEQQRNSEFCQWNRYVCALLPNGDVSICGNASLHKELVAGNVENQSIAAIWKRSPFFRMIHKIRPSDLKGVCGRCIANEYCLGMCRAFAYSRFRSILAPYPVCQDFYDNGCFPKEALQDVKVELR
jgi:radical SAM protein with 4Fe4S-binding SPASM domain